MKLVLATQNPKKLKEMNEILRHLGVEVVSEAELGVRIEVEETGETFTDNARLKATAVMQATGLPAVADDSGLCVDALNGGPGVYSARFGGEGLDDKGRYTLLLEMLRGQTDRAAHFHTSIVCAFPNGDELVCEGECPAPSRSRRWARAASATTPYSLCLSCARPSASSRRRKRRPSRIAGKRCAPLPRHSTTI